MNRQAKYALLLTFLVLVLLSSTAGAQGLGPIYIVQPGDNLISIAQTFGTTVQALAEANDIDDPSLLIPGMELIIPGYEGIQGVLIIREVEFGESLQSLSLQHGIHPEDLARLNRLVNPARLYAGQPLILPEDEDNPASMPSSTNIRLRPGESKLEAAVRTGVNPWSLFPPEEDKVQMWGVPDSSLVLRGGSRETSALPQPLSSVGIQPLPLVQGRTTVLLLNYDQPIWIEGSLGGRTLHFFANDSLQSVSLVGIHAMADPDLYNLEIRIYDSQGGDLLFSYSQPVRVRQGGYGFETVNGVPPETVNPEITEPEQEMVEALLSEATPEKLWNGTFDYPSNYYTESFLSLFGTRRSYNWGAYDYYHTGLDFYGGTGVEILAPARGQVVYTGSLTVRGNVTYIDHGWGVYSGYFHQSEILVSTGDVVEPGQVIGLVGGTGRSTGPHLHWEVWVGGVPVNPLEWVEVGFP